MYKFRNTVYISICRIAIDDEYTKFYDQIIGVYDNLKLAKEKGSIVQLVKTNMDIVPIIEYRKIENKWIEKKMDKWYQLTGEPLPF